MTDPEMREIRDSKVLAAMSHLLRRRLMDVLEVYGPSTASATGIAGCQIRSVVTTMS